MYLQQIIRAGIGSATEADVGGLNMNAQEALPKRKTLRELNHPQPATPMRIDNIV